LLSLSSLALAPDLALALSLLLVFSLSLSLCYTFRGVQRRFFHSIPLFFVGGNEKTDIKQKQKTYAQVLFFVGGKKKTDWFGGKIIRKASANEWLVLYISVYICPWRRRRPSASPGENFALKFVGGSHSCRLGRPAVPVDSMWEVSRQECIPVRNAFLWQEWVPAGAPLPASNTWACRGAPPAPWT